MGIEDNAATRRPGVYMKHLPVSEMAILWKLTLSESFYRVGIERFQVLGAFELMRRESTAGVGLKRRHWLRFVHEVG
jgi:hypothetical protein